MSVLKKVFNSVIFGSQKRSYEGFGQIESGIEETLSLLGLLAKDQSVVSVLISLISGKDPLGLHGLILFLEFGRGREACFRLSTGRPGIALQPGSAHKILQKLEKYYIIVDWVRPVT